MLQYFSAETLKLMGLKTPEIHLSISKNNIKIPASELLWSSKPFEAFYWDIKRYYSLTNLQTYAIALNYFYFKWPEQVSICQLKQMFLIQPSFFFVRHLCTIAQRKTCQDTMPLHLTNGNTPCLPKFTVLLHSKLDLGKVNHYFTLLLLEE